MTSKQELQATLVEIQKRFAEVSAELKKINEQEKLHRKVQKFSEYKYKVPLMDKGLSDSLEPLNESDYADCEVGKDSIPYMKYATSSTRDYILLKDESELPRMRTLFSRMQAMMSLGSEGANNEDLIKVILGEKA